MHHSRISVVEIIKSHWYVGFYGENESVLAACENQQEAEWMWGTIYEILWQLII